MEGPRPVSQFRRCVRPGAVYDQQHPDGPRDGAKHHDLFSDGGDHRGGRRTSPGSALRGDFFLVERCGADPRLSALLGAGTVVGLRLAALQLGWRLPVMKIKRSW